MVRRRQGSRQGLGPSLKPPVGGSKANGGVVRRQIAIHPHHPPMGGRRRHLFPSRQVIGAAAGRRPETLTKIPKEHLAFRTYRHVYVAPEHLARFAHIRGRRFRQEVPIWNDQSLSHRGVTNRAIGRIIVTMQNVEHGAAGSEN